MEIDQKTKYIAAGAVGALLLVCAGIGIGKLMFKNSVPESASTAEAGISTSSASGAQETERQTQSAAPESAPKLSACETSVNAAAARQGTGYEHGSILVSFDEDVAYAEALAILDSFGLEPHNTASSKTDFAANHWLAVAVAAQQESKQICVLRDQPGIKYAGLNYTFKLAE